MNYQNKKILYVHHGGSVGGAPIALFNIIKRVDRSRFNPVVIFTCNGPVVRMFQMAGIEIRMAFVPLIDHHLGFWWQIRHLKVIIKFIIGCIPGLICSYKLIKKEKPYIVHLNSSTLIVFGLAAKMAGVKIVWHVREIITPGYFGLRRKLISYVIDVLSEQVIAVSNIAAAPLRKSNKLSVIYDGVEIHEYLPCEPAKEVINELRLKEGEFRIAYIGQLYKGKGVLTLIDALYLVKNKTSKPFKFLMIGGDITKKKRFLNEIMVKIKAYNLEDYFICLGERTDIRNLLSVIDVLVFPSGIDSFGLPIAEAGAMRKTAIGCNVGGPAEIILDEETGLLVNNCEPADIANAILRLMNNQTMIATLGEKARERVLTYFNNDVNCAKIMSIYDQLVNHLKIKILTNCYPPEIGGGPNLLLELAQALTKMGCEVSVITRFPRHLPKNITPKYSGWLFAREKRPEAEVIRINIPEFSRKIFLLRELEHFLNTLFLIFAAARGRCSDITLVYSPPIVVGYAALISNIFNKSKIVLNVQDIFPQNLIDLGLIKNRLLIAVARFLERLLYRYVDWITVMSEGNKEIVVKTANNKHKVTVIPNWINPNSIVPKELMNDFRTENGLGDKFVLSFAGCMSDSQDMNIILAAAEKLISRHKIVFLLAGNGPNYSFIVQRINKQKLSNVVILPIQPPEQYSQLMAASNVGLVTLSPLVATPTIPSKIKSIMSAGRPILASLPNPGQSDAARLIKEAECGIVVNAGDTETFVEQILILFGNRQLCHVLGKKGREYILTNLTVDICAKQYRLLFDALVTS